MELVGVDLTVFESYSFVRMLPLSEPAVLELVSAVTAPNEDEELAVASEEAELEEVAEDVAFVGDKGWAMVAETLLGCGGRGTAIVTGSDDIPFDPTNC